MDGNNQTKKKILLWQIQKSVFLIAHFALKKTHLFKVKEMFFPFFYKGTSALW